MKNIISLLVVLLYGCAHITTSEQLYNTYSKYNHNLNKQNVLKYYHQFFHPDLTKSVNAKNDNSLSQFLFYTYMAKENGHYEKIYGNSGCLTVNGIDSDNRMIAFYIEYKNYNDKWLMSDIDVSFIEKSMHYKHEALCPALTRVQ